MACDFTVGFTLDLESRFYAEMHWPSACVFANGPESGEEFL